MHCLVTSLKKNLSLNLDSKNGDRDRMRPVAIIRVKDGDLRTTSLPRRRSSMTVNVTVPSRKTVKSRRKTGKNTYMDGDRRIP